MLSLSIVQRSFRSEGLEINGQRVTVTTVSVCAPLSCVVMRHVCCLTQFCAFMRASDALMRASDGVSLCHVPHHVSRPPLCSLFSVLPHPPPFHTRNTILLAT